MFKRKKKDAEQPQQQEDSVDSILSKIKNVVSGKENVKIEDEAAPKKKPSSKKIIEEEPLELTEIVGDEDEGGEQHDVAKNDEASVLENILKTLDPSKFAAQTSQNNNSEVNPEEEGFVDVLKQIDDEFKNVTVSVDENNIIENAVQQNTIEETNFDIEAELSQNNVEQEIVADNILEDIIEEQKPEEQIIENIAVANNDIEMTENTNENNAIISDEIASKSSSAIKQLMDNIPRPKIESPQFASGNTVENLVLESLKPMLKEWLDKNLDTIVKDIVQKEIRKLIPRE